jgi:hypothetical protein
VVKLNPAGSQLLYSTYLGGPAPESLGTGGRRIAIGPTGIAYIGGMTYDRDFPTTPGAFQTVDNKPSLPTSGAIFVTALNATGTALVYSTFLDGGDSPNGAAAQNGISGIATDSQDNAYICGTAGSPDFPTTPGSFRPNRYGLSAQAGGVDFVTKLNPAGSAMVYSTYVGDNTNSDAIGNSLAVDAQGSAYITGVAQEPTGGTGRGNPHKRTAQDVPVQGVVTSSDGGATWTAINDGLFDGMSLNVIAVDPNNSSNIYLGAFEGLFIKTGSKSWTAVQGASQGALQITAASITGKKLIVEGEGFGMGADIIVNGTAMATANSSTAPSTSLVSKKAANRSPRARL